MNKLVNGVILMILGVVSIHAQTPVSVGSGSYASFPPASENQDDWNGDGQGDLYPFVFDQPIYVSDNETRPIPTNDWWTDLIIQQYGGLMWAYPLVINPEDYGVQLFYPNSFVPDGSNMEYGGSMTISAANYAPDKAIASDWSDWGVKMSMPQASNNTNMDVTFAHGVPFAWFETQGIDPELSFDQGASYLTAGGAAVQFPTTSSFVVQTDGRYFGIHLDGTSSAEIQGQQYVTIDLGSAQTITDVDLHWETAFASGYSLQVSNDNTNWTTVYSETNGDGGYDSLSVAASGRYVKIVLSERGTIYAYSLWEVEIYNGATLLSSGQPVEVSSYEAFYTGNLVTDNNHGTRWASDGSQQESLVLNTGSGNAYFVVSALPSPADLTTYGAYAYNKVVDTEVQYDYDVIAGEVDVDWNITTVNLQGGAAGNTIQGFIPHQYEIADNSISFTANNYVTSRGTMKTAIGNSFSFTYDFGGILPNYNAPYLNSGDADPYDAEVMFDLLTRFSKKQGYGGDTYWGGKDLVNFAKYTLMAKEMNHQAYESLKSKTREALVNWLTYTPGETEKFYARYDRWGAIVGFNESYGSSQFTDNHFHYGYLVLASALYGMVDQSFLDDYGDMIKLIAQQYANWDRSDTFLPYMRTFDPWIGHSYAGGTSSSTGNNQESTSEAMQSWIGLFLLGDVLGDDDILDLGAFGYISEAYATLEYWFDWKERNLPANYAHNVVGILSNQGFAYGTYFSASPVHIHGIQYLPVNPGFKYLAEDPTWAAREYNDMMVEAANIDGHTGETDFGDDWAHVALGFRQLFDPEYVSEFMADNLALGSSSADYIMDYEVAGMTYYYTHANQNLGDFSFDYHTNFPSSSVFEENGNFSYAVAYNPASTTQTCNVYNASGTVIASFSVPAKTLVTYPQLPATGQQPAGCYGLLSAAASATSGNPDAAIDGNPGSRWESAFSDPQAITVDLGIGSAISEVTLSWETANAQEYYLLASNDSINWDTLAVQTGMAAGERVDTISGLSGNYRYLQMYGTVRNGVWGYSIYEFEICGSATTSAGVILPAFIEAEDYTAMSGVQLEATADAGGGDNVGWIDTGDWMEYEVNSPGSTTYDIDLRVAALYAGGEIEIFTDNTSLGTVTVPSTGGWQVWTTVSTTVSLPAGAQTLRVEAETGGFNVNWIDVQLASGSLINQSGPGAEKQGDRISIAIFPNPADEEINIFTDESGMFTIRDLQGRLVKQGAVKEGLNRVDIKNLAMGVYLIRLQGEVRQIVIR
ncbi:MAG: hypothetical protein CMI36_12185 [Owenweeksia sp.]|nr:hypothetical protein [Owenweeksia sp.]